MQTPTMNRGPNAKDSTEAFIYTEVWSSAGVTLQALLQQLQGGQAGCNLVCLQEARGRLLLPRPAMLDEVQYAHCVVQGASQSQNKVVLRSSVCRRRLPRVWSRARVDVGLRGG